MVTQPVAAESAMAMPVPTHFSSQVLTNYARPQHTSHQYVAENRGAMKAIPISRSSNSSTKLKQVAVASQMEKKIEKCKRSLLKRLDEVKDENQPVIENRDKSLFLQTRSQRGSKFRGVSKNGCKWQVCSRRTLIYSLFLSLISFCSIGHDCTRRSEEVHWRNRP